MPLEFTENQFTSERFETILEAFDGKKRVLVISSQEAIEDHGIDAVHQKAADKYDAGQVDDEGRVKVFTHDL